MVTAFAVLTAVPALGLGPTASEAVAEEAPAEQAAGQKELAEAKESGKRVEVLGERSERTTVYANPDGYSFTLEESAVPVRVSKPGGGWRTPDATLEVRSDGTIAPKAAAVEMEFSGGGDDAPLVKIAEGGRSLRLGWEGKLPEPRLDGTSALYEEVLPGVDLKVTASVEGFRHVLVVKTPEAAENASLERIDYPLNADGLRLVKGEAGNLTAVDSAGNRVFRAPPAQMWDSAGTDADETDAPAEEATGTTNGDATTAVTEATPTTADATTAATATEARTVSATLAAPATTGTEGPKAAADAAETPDGTEPRAGDKVARMDVKLSTDALSVIPDAEMLTGTKESAFPLFIDPTVTWGESERTLLRSDGYESYGWSNGDDDLGKGVGECGTWNGYYCGPGYVQRLYFEFSPASLKGKHVLDATFRVTEPWAFQCDPRWVDLVRTNNISSSTTWSSRPAHLDLMGDRHVSAGRGSLCDPDSPDAPIEFNDDPAETDENLTPTVRNFAAGKFSRLTLMLKAKDETDTAAWKRFKNDAVLAVQFVGLPSQPTSPGLVTGTGTVCETAAADPAVVSDPTPTLTGVVQTKAGGESGSSLRAHFYVQRRGADGAYSLLTEPERPSSGYVGDGTKVSVSSPVTLSDGTFYRMAAFTRSYYDGGGSYLQSSSTVTTKGWCYFKVDSTAPKAPKISIAAPYSECTTNDCAAGGGPGKAGKFTFAPATGDANNVAYQYKLSSADAWSSEIKGATATASIAPERSGTHSVYVRAKDDVGRWGAQNTVDFLVAAGEGPVGRWHFDEASGAAVDVATSDGSDNATLGGSAVRDDRGRRGLITHDGQGVPLEEPVTDKGLYLNGTTGYAQTGAPVLETRSAFTLSAWVRLDENDAYATVLSQRGPDGSPFAFWYSGGSKTWYFGVSKPDGSGYSGVSAVYAAQTKVWTHLAGSYDPGTGEVRFYVDGRLQRSAVTVEGSYESTYPMQFGRVQNGASSYVYQFPGSIDEVAVWQRVLTPKEIVTEAQLLVSDGFAGAELVADWKAELGSGTTVPDTTSGYGRSLTLSGGAALNNGEIVLDGTDDSATAPGPLVYDHAPFTVSTLVTLDAAKLAAKDVGYTGQVLGQRTEDGSAWGFWFKLTGKDTVLDEETLEERTVPVGVWHFGRLNADGTFSSVASDAAAALDSPVRLTGIYNSLTGTISLYLGHNQNGDDTAFTVKLGTGDFAIGKGFTEGAWKHHLPARVAEARLWAGAMAGSEQIDHQVGD